MDLWVVAAAAGAGYMVKANYLKNSPSRLRDTSMESFSCDHVHGQFQSPNLLQRIQVITCPLYRLAACRKAATDGSLDRDVTGVVSRIGIPNSQIVLQKYATYGRNEFFDVSSESLAEFMLGEVGSFQRLTTGKPLNSKSNGYVLKPVTLIQSYPTSEL